MSFTLVPGYNWSDGEVVTEAKLDLAALPTLADGQTYTFGAGTAAAPSVNFTGGATTGFYLGTTAIGFSVGAASVGTWSATGLNVSGTFTATGRTRATYGIFNGLLSAYDSVTGGIYLGYNSGSIIRSVSDNAGSAANISIEVGNGTQVAQFTSTGFAVASGLILTLGNAYVATPPTCTGYVTLKDVNGVTYKVLVST